MPTLLLVHGAWCAGCVWDRLVPELQLLGVSSRVIDLPGHGQATRSMWSVSLLDYADAVIDAASAIEGPVVAVGHSMGGVVISAAAAKSPERFQALAYLTAFLPRHGERLASLSARDRQSRLGNAIRAHVFSGTTSLAADSVCEALFNDCSPEEAARGKSLIQANPIRPAFARAHLGAQFARTPKHYIHCTKDCSISPAHQEWMAGRYAMKSIQALESGHMPMYSAPQELAAALANIATQESIAH